MWADTTGEGGECQRGSPRSAGVEGGGLRRQEERIEGIQMDFEGKDPPKQSLRNDQELTKL